MPLADVVGPLLERADALDRVGAGLGQHDHRHVAIPASTGLTGAQATAQVGLGEDHDVGRLPLGEIEGAGAPRRFEHLEAVAAQVALEGRPRGGLGICEEDGAGSHPTEATDARAGTPDVLCGGSASRRPQAAASSCRQSPVAVRAS